MAYLVSVGQIGWKSLSHLMSTMITCYFFNFDSYQYLAEKSLIWKFRTKLNNSILIFKKYFIYLFLERGEGREKKRERNINVREKHWLVASQTLLGQGPNPPPRHVPWLRIELATLALQDDAQPIEPQLFRDSSILILFPTSLWRQSLQYFPKWIPVKY